MLKPTLDNVGRAAHPRSRGEHDQQDNAHYPLLGSSPLARGTSDSVLHSRRTFRLIPARAGNIDEIPEHYRLQAAHPRSRGEHFTVEAVAAHFVGSSPLARGTWVLSLETLPRFRLIPARAGNI